MKPQHEASFLNIVPFLGGFSANGSGWQTLYLLFYQAVSHPCENEALSHFAARALSFSTVCCPGASPAPIRRVTVSGRSRTRSVSVTT